MSESGVKQPTAKWICGGCAKVVSSRPFGRCHDCGGAYRRATAEDLACDRCGDDDSRRLLDRTGEFDRLCPSCIDEVALLTEKAEEYRFYVYEQDDDDPRYAFYMSVKNAGELCIFDRPPEGRGMWHSTVKDRDHVEPSDELIEVLGRLADGEEIHSDDLTPLAGHERHFVDAVFWTRKQTDTALPEEAKGFLVRCRRER